MSNLSWNEIRQRAIQFAHDWQDVTDERAEAQSFWNEFFSGLRHPPSDCGLLRGVAQKSEELETSTYRLSLSRSYANTQPSPTSTCPPPRLKAHQNLDRAVDRCYRNEKFETERERVEFLFGLNEEISRQP